MRASLTVKRRGVDMVIDVKWTTKGNEFIEGEMYSESSRMGMTCEYYRPFEITFKEPIDEDDYNKLKKKMEKKLNKLLKRRQKG
jgi:hypothetical protein